MTDVTNGPAHNDEATTTEKIRVLLEQSSLNAPEHRSLEHLVPISQTAALHRRIESSAQQHNPEHSAVKAPTLRTRLQKRTQADWPSGESPLDTLARKARTNPEVRAEFRSTARAWVVTFWDTFKPLADPLQDPDRLITQAWHQWRRSNLVGMSFEQVLARELDEKLAEHSRTVPVRKVPVRVKVVTGPKRKPVSIVVTEGDKTTNVHLSTYALGLPDEQRSAYIKSLLRRKLLFPISTRDINVVGYKVASGDPVELVVEQVELVIKNPPPARPSGVLYRTYDAAKDIDLPHRRR